MTVTAESDFEAVFASMRASRIDALLVGTDPLFVKSIGQLVELTRDHRIPAIYDRREFAEAGGLMSYGSNIAAGYRKGGAYAAQILKGARPSDLPVEQAAIFELVVNMKTARELGITMPPAILAGADELIE
jgi:putative ABC transport system substrate-binding protein